MLIWKITNEDEELKKEINRIKENFESWYMNSWSKRCTREKMLSEESPVPHIYYKICKSFDEVKEKFPCKETCSSCGKEVSEWIETSFSFCDEYGCGMSLCKECAEKLRNQINNWIK